MPAIINTIDTIANLEAGGAPASTPATTIVQGYTNPGDGGTFWWNSTSTAADNGGTIIQATGVPTGRWYRLLDNGIAWPEMFGAAGDGSTDDTTAIQNLLNAASSTSFLRCLFPRRYLCGNVTILNTTGLCLEGHPDNRGDLSSSSGSVGRLIAKSGSSYIFASYNYVNNVSSAGEPVNIFGLLFEGNANATNCVVLMSWGGSVEQCTFRDATEDGFVFTYQTANGTAITNTLPNMHIRRNLFYGSGGHGFRVLNGQPFKRRTGKYNVQCSA